MTEPLHITAKDNPLLQRLRKLLRDGAAYRKTGALWLEGEHLCSALLQHGRRPAQAVLAEAAWAQPALRLLAQAAPRVVLVPDTLFDGLSSLPSPAGIGFLLPLPAQPAVDPQAATVVLDRLQDAGNVGSILRSAAAFGVQQVLALQGTVALWSPKVLRAGMGAHFGLRLLEGLQPPTWTPWPCRWSAPAWRPMPCCPPPPCPAPVPGCWATKDKAWHLRC